LLLRLLANGFTVEALIGILFFIPVFFITITVHECAHGYIAYKLGDPTARNLGRLTLNPIKHIDPIGLIMIAVIGFGWAKPVPIIPRYFKNPKSGMAISAAAGPVSNILMAIIGLLLYAILLQIFISANIVNVFAASALIFADYFATLNVWFAVFNLIPLPPLDGSRIVSYFLSPKLHYYYNYVERYGFLILILLLNMGRLGSRIWIFRYLDILSGLEILSTWVLRGLKVPINWIFSLFGG